MFIGSMKRVESHDSLPITQQIVAIKFCRQIQIRPRIFLGTSEDLHALDGYCSLCYRLSYKISV